MVRVSLKDLAKASKINDLQAASKRFFITEIEVKASDLYHVSFLGGGFLVKYTAVTLFSQTKA